MVSIKKFWNHKAKKYPRPFEKMVLNETLKVIEKIEKLGIKFWNKKIIDIGCGTGIYGLVFSKYKNSNVFCIDISENMLNILNEEAENNNLIVNSLCCDFSSFDIKDYEKSFDISFASMTPAVKDKDDVLKMEKLSKGYCVFIGLAGRRENKIVDEIIKIHNIKPYIPEGFFIVKKNLESRNVKYKSFTFDTQWQWSGSVDEAVEEISIRISLDTKPNKNLIKKFLADIFKKGNVIMKTKAREGVIIWEPS